jgi:UDP-N-acetylmuramoyl-tripeptide--D-alanyl-D-alanine ligase
VLGAWVGEAARLATRGNLNNDVGVPLTVLRLDASHRAAVIELGMNRPGEIAWLARIAQARVALVNNAQREHQEFLGSVEATARENGEAIAALPADGVAVYPGDDVHAPIWHALAAGRRTLTFGTDAACAVRAAPASRPDGFEMTIEGAPLAVSLAIDGAHNVRNALAAAACCHAIGVPAATIAAGLAVFRPASGRLRRVAATTGAAVIDDSYNANPDSVRAAIDVLAQHAAPRILVLGDMAEVGDEGPAYHAEVGAYAKQRGIDRLLAFGPASAATAAAFGDGAEHLATIEDACWRATRLASAQATVLVKGSRSMRMERVVRALAGADAGDGGHH